MNIYYRASSDVERHAELSENLPSLEGQHFVDNSKDFLAKHAIRTLLLGWNLLKFKTQSRWISAHLMFQHQRDQPKTKRVRVK